MVDDLGYNQSRSFNVGIAKELGITAALLFDEFSFWSDKGRRPDGWVYKSYAELMGRIPKSERQLRRAVKVLEEANYIEKKIMKANGAPTLHFRVKVRLVPERDTKLPKMSGTIRTSVSGTETDGNRTSVSETINSNTSTNIHKENSPLEELLEEFTLMRKTIRRPLTLKGRELILKKLRRLAPDEATQCLILEQSIANSWQGVFALKDDPAQQEAIF